jgi:uncharacterized protein (TIGR02453 family)
VPPAPFFTEETLRFLRGLRRNNDREWFEARREIFERAVKAPMLALIERLTSGMVDYAPDHVRPAAKCLFRIYRDTRFSPDKSPYKTHLGAWWSHTGMPKTSGAGFYTHIGSAEFVVAAGAYMPEKDQTLAIRRHLLEHHAEWKSLIENSKLLREFSVHDPMALTRAPKGFPPDHPAIRWIQWRQWGVTVHLPAEFALRPTLAADIEKRFRLAAPLVRFLNAPLVAAPRPRRVWTAALPRK